MTKVQQIVSPRYRACGACASDQQSSVFLVRSYFGGGFGRFVECADCGTLQVVDEVDYEALYATRDSINYPSAGEGFLARQFLQLKHFYMALLVPKLFEGVDAGAIVLDYGCGSGDLVNAATKLRGGRIFAADVQIERPATLSQEIEYMPTTDIPENIKFDFVVLRHVLEHVQYPADALRELKQHLSASGEILIEVPCPRSTFRKIMGSRWPGYYFPYHVFVFSEKGMRRLAAASGYEVVRYAVNNPPIFGAFFMTLGMNRSLARMLSIALYPVQWIVNVVSRGPEAFSVRLKPIS